MEAEAQERRLEAQRGVPALGPVGGLGADAHLSGPAGACVGDAVTDQRSGDAATAVLAQGEEVLDDADPSGSSSEERWTTAESGEQR